MEWLEQMNNAGMEMTQLAFVFLIYGIGMSVAAVHP